MLIRSSILAAILSFLTIIFIVQSGISQNDSTFTESSSVEGFDAPGDEFSSPGDEFSVPGDEFTSGTESGDEFQETDEFSEFSDGEFSEVGNIDELATAGSCAGCPSGGMKASNDLLYWVLGVLAATILAGIFVRFRILRPLRGAFLVAAVIILGFYRGACPCPIMSFQNVILAGLGEHVHWHHMLWFLGLIPITYLFGRVWCGWICHLGAIQEFLYLPGKVSILQNARSQMIMRYVRGTLIIVLIVQLILTKTNLFKEIDPFKVAFNLYSANMTGWILLALILVSSLFIYRPFCKTACPIGLVLGWITKIPGASVIGLKGKCVQCVSCNDACNIRAITRSRKFSVIENQECIACGECIDSCRQSGLKFVRKNRINNDKIVCKYTTMGDSSSGDIIH